MNDYLWTLKVIRVGGEGCGVSPVVCEIEDYRASGKQNALCVGGAHMIDRYRNHSGGFGSLKEMGHELKNYGRVLSGRYKAYATPSLEL